MTNRGYSNNAGYGPQNHYQRPNYNGGGGGSGYDPDRYYGRPHGQGQMQQQRPDQPEYYDRPSGKVAPVTNRISHATDCISQDCIL